MTTKNNEWLGFFNQYSIFEKKSAGQKARGLNDYSLINSLLKVDDEVRLHSRFLYSMINPESKHYQGTLFLKLFLESVQYPDWLDVDKSSVSIETKLDDLEGMTGFIDIYVTDGTRHIVIENKINAKDQNNQLARYVDLVKNAYNAEPENLLFIYLSKGRAKPDDNSFGNYQLSSDDTQVVDDKKNAVARYLSISFNKEIRCWVNRCLEETINLTNLNSAFKEYKHIIDKLTKRYKSNVMGLSDFLTQGKDIKAKRDFARIANAIALELPEVKAQWCNKALTEELVALLCSQYKCTLMDEKTYPKMKANALTLDTLKRFFKNESGGKQKYLLFSISSGKYANEIGVLVVLATKYLYVGIVGLLKSSDDEYQTNENKELPEDLTIEASRYEQYGFKYHKAAWINELDKGFVGYKAWVIDAHEAALDMQDFHTSNLKSVVELMVRDVVS
ncbi:MAG: hypothetical protein ACJAS1_007272 [Oleiphilaceae bacterium]|jgi:hypothetical protein